MKTHIHSIDVFLYDDDRILGVPSTFGDSNINVHTAIRVGPLTLYFEDGGTFLEEFSEFLQKVVYERRKKKMVQKWDAQQKEIALPEVE
jgi:hypothetical protein